MTHNYTLTKKWLDQTPLVVAGYFDRVCGVDLFHLLYLWHDCELEREDFSERYPYAAQFFQVKVDDVAASEIGKFLPAFGGCLYLQCWYYGELIVLSPQV